MEKIRLVSGYREGSEKLRRLVISPSLLPSLDAFSSLFFSPVYFSLNCYTGVSIELMTSYMCKHNHPLYPFSQPLSVGLPLPLWQSLIPTPTHSITHFLPLTQWTTPSHSLTHCTTPTHSLSVQLPLPPSLPHSNTLSPTPLSIFHNTNLYLFSIPHARVEPSLVMRKQSCISFSSCSRLLGIKIPWGKGK